MQSARDKTAKATSIAIPRLGINQSLVALHVQPDRSLSVPKDFGDVGWWSEGPAPGEAGAVIVAAHVSSKSGPGAFIRLRELRRDDRVVVDRADGTTAVFQVQGKASYPRDEFPSQVVYRTSGKASIHLITCDGVFDTSIGHYGNNLVIFADLISTSRTRNRAA